MRARVAAVNFALAGGFFSISNQFSVKIFLIRDKK
jgi:hypothetical protein